jgi:hypothetical protein
MYSGGAPIGQARAGPGLPSRLTGSGINLSYAPPVPPGSAFRCSVFIDLDDRETISRVDLRFDPGRRL